MKSNKKIIKKFRLIHTEVVGKGIFRLELVNPEKRNAMTEEMATEFYSTINTLRKDSNVRVVILSGEGNVFSAGGDLEMLAGKIKLSKKKNKDLMIDFYKKFLSITKLNVPVVAAINGHAMGAGLCLALACDVRFCISNAKLGLNFVHLGLHPGMGATYFLPRLVGPARAGELLFSGKVLTADEGHKIGLVNYVCDEANFQSSVLEFASQIAAASPQAIKELKQTMSYLQKGKLDAALKQEAAAQAKDYEGKDFKEGITAAIEKRKPKF